MAFERLYSWRNGRNGMTVGSVGGFQLIDAVLADNNERGIEILGADSAASSGQSNAVMDQVRAGHLAGAGPLWSVGKLRGPWGSNVLKGTTIIGHALPPAVGSGGKLLSPFVPAVEPRIGSRGTWIAKQHSRPAEYGCANGVACDSCPACDQTADHSRPFRPCTEGRKTASILFADLKCVRVGMTLPAWLGLSLENTTFANFDRDGLEAVSGYAKAMPLNGGYTNIGGGGAQTRFTATRWLHSPIRVRWRWEDEALLNDTDGTFTENAPGAQCQVVMNGLANDDVQKPFGDKCYQDVRYGGPVCCGMRWVPIGFVQCTLCLDWMRVSYKGDDAPSCSKPGGCNFVPDDDTKYLRNKWRPAGAYQLVEMDIMSAHPSPRFVIDRAVTGRDGVERAFENVPKPGGRRIIGVKDPGMYPHYKTFEKFPNDKARDTWGRPGGDWTGRAPVRAVHRSMFFICPALRKPLASLSWCLDRRCWVPTRRWRGGITRRANG